MSNNSNMSNTTEILNIVLSMDENNLDGMLTVINSIVTNTKHLDKIVFYLLVYEDSNEEIKNNLTRYFVNKIKYKIEEFIKYPAYVDFLNANMNITNTNKKFKHISNIMNFARFYLPLIYDNIDFGLYLDSDIVVQVDILDILNNIDIENTIIASPLTKPIDSMQIHEKFGMTGNGFNTGVYFLNFKYWRDNNLTQKCEEIMIEHKITPLFILGTQPIINILFYEKCINLDKKWNYTGLGSKEYDQAKLARQYILHWTGEHKPWNDGGLNKAAWEKYKITNPLTPM